MRVYAQSVTSTVLRFIRETGRANEVGGAKRGGVHAYTHTQTFFKNDVLLSFSPSLPPMQTHFICLEQKALIIIAAAVSGSGDLGFSAVCGLVP